MHSILFATPWFNVYSYGVMIAVGYSVATFWIVREANKDGLPGESVFDMLLLQLVVGVFGSRFFFMVESGELFNPSTSFLDFERGGLTFYGCVFSSLIFDLVFLRMKNLSFWRVMDCVGMGLPLGIGLARLGCLLNGCCYGVPCAYPWGVIFPAAQLHVPLHPAQLYESLGGFVIFFILQALKTRRKSYGQALILSLTMYGVFRFFLEFFRGDNSIFFLGMTFSQTLSIILLIMALFAWKAISQSKDLRITPKTLK